MENYILVSWPESQEFMDEVWFEKESCLADVKFGDSAYFIPESRIINNEYILQKVEELAALLETIKEDEDYIDEEWESNDSFGGVMSTFEAILNIKLHTRENS